MAGQDNGGPEPRRQKLGEVVSLLRHIANLLTVLGGLYLAQWPLAVIRDTVEPFAGTETIVKANIALSATATLSLAVNGFQLIRARSHSKELERERSRSTDLEAEVRLLQEKLAAQARPARHPRGRSTRPQKGD